MITRWGSIAIALCAVCMVPSFVYAADTACTHDIEYKESVPGGFGVPYSFSSKETFITLERCGNDLGLFEAGEQGEEYLIYPKGYYNTGAGWKEFSYLSSEGKQSIWLTGNATALVPLTDETIVATYMCKRTAGGFECGCKNEACSGNRWTYQSFSTEESTGDSRTNSRNDSQSSSRSSDRWVMGYYPSWDRTRLEPHDIEWDYLTHIAFGSVGVIDSDELNLSFGFSDEDDAEDFAREVSRRAKNEGVVPILFVGGANGGVEGWLNATTDRNAEEFAETLYEAMEDLGYEGIDIDWEPLKNEHVPSLIRLVRELRKLDDEMVITVALPHVNGNSLNPTEEYGELARYVDQLNTMTYDMSGTWPGWQSWHHSALRGDTNTYPSSVEDTAEAFLDAGIPKRQLGIGAPFYGYCWQGVNGPRQDQNIYTKNMGAMSYRLIMREYFDKDALQWDGRALADYLSFSRPVGDDRCQFITYMDKRGAEERGEWIVEQGLGGVIIWSLGQAHMDENRRGERHPLLEALWKGIDG